MTEPAPAAPTIRLATNADVLSMAKVHVLCWRETYPGLLPRRMLERLSIADEAIRWQRMLDRPSGLDGTLAFVADRQGSIVGYGTCNEQRTMLLRDRGFTGEVSELYVLRPEQRQGIGSGLMKAMAGALLERGYFGLSLWVLGQNDSACRFYERIGGTLIAEKRSNLAEVAYGWSDLRTLIH